MLIESPMIRAMMYGIAVVLGSCFSLTAAAASTAKAVSTAEALAFPCYTCHGTDGKSPGAIPSLSEYDADKLREKLLAFKRDQHDPTIMNRIAKGYSDDEIQRLSEFLGALSKAHSEEKTQ